MTKAVDQDAVEQLLHRHDAEEIVSAVQEKIAAEQRRREEFYEWLDEDKKAEFIDGEIVVHSPVMKRHADATLLLTSLLSPYSRIKQIGYVGSEKLLVRLKRDDFEPDVAFWFADRARAFTEDQLFFIAPNFVAEVLSKGTEDIDRGRKFISYAANGVDEYWIVDAKAKRVECHDLQPDGTYLLRETVGLSEQLISTAIQDFSVPCLAIFDSEANLDALDEIMSLRRKRK